MNYCTVNDLTLRFGEDEIISLSGGDVDGAIKQDKVNLALTDAHTVVNSYLKKSGHDALDVDTIKASPVPLYTANIARYLLAQDVPTDEMKDRYKEAIAWLKDLVNNQSAISPDGSENSNDGSSHSGSFKVHGPNRSLDLEAY